MRKAGYTFIKIPEGVPEYRKIRILRNKWNIGEKITDRTQIEGKIKACRVLCRLFQHIIMIRSRRYG